MQAKLRTAELHRNVVICYNIIASGMASIDGQVP